MSEFALVSGDMRTAGSAVEDAAAEARGADGSGSVGLLAGALPGTTTAQVAPDLAAAWAEGVRAWADRVERLGAAIERLRVDAGAVDQEAAGLLGAGGPR